MIKKNDTLWVALWPEQYRDKRFALFIVIVFMNQSIANIHTVLKLMQVCLQYICKNAILHYYFFQISKEMINFYDNVHGKGITYNNEDKQAATTVLKVFHETVSGPHLLGHKTIIKWFNNQFINQMMLEKHIYLINVISGFQLQCCGKGDFLSIADKWLTDSCPADLRLGEVCVSLLLHWNEEFLIKLSSIL